MAALGFFSTGMTIASEPDASLPSLCQNFKDSFTIGTAVPPLGLLSKSERSFISKHFNAVTPENCMKPAFLHPSENTFDFHTADDFLDVARRLNLKVNGHTLVWHSQTPEWFFTDHGNPAGREILLPRMREHIQRIVGHFSGKIQSWDVVNEAIDDGPGYLRPSPWLTGIGQDYIAEAFAAAHKADPDAELVYNDYGIETPAKREKTLRLIRELKKANAPIHGIGIQGHYQLDKIPLKDLEDSIIAYHAEGLSVMITELDIDVALRASNSADISTTEAKSKDRYAAGLPDDLQNRLADQYAALFSLFLKHSDKVRRVTIWGIHDGYSWLNHFPSTRTNHPLLWDRTLGAKPAFFRVIETARALKSQTQNH